MTTIIEKAKQTPNATNTETSYLPIKDIIPKNLLEGLNIPLNSKDDYIYVVEIQFDTNKIVLQPHNNKNGENYDEVYPYYIDSLNQNFKEWVLNSLS